MRELVDIADLERAADVLAAIWLTPTGEPPMAPALLRALEHSGNYVAGAFVDGELVGASAAWFGHDGDELILHSHITGVLPRHQSRDVGFSLKQHQRRWALERGVIAIQWTFDPLVRRNAYFNLTRLGATIVGYERDLYGAMQDAANAGEETDRAIVRWRLDAGPATPAEGVIILSADERGAPCVTPSTAATLKAWIPEDYVRDRTQLAGWRQAVRDAIGTAIDQGYVAMHMSRDGWYTLVRR